jgi:catechol 2,3-dioxygenase-like lactoylglutathione lyase family enzyme
VVVTADAEAAKRLYGDALGLRCALDREFPQWGARLIFHRVGDVTVELAARLDAADLDPARDRLFGLSWRVPDADAARARLLAAGVDASEVRTGRKPGTRVLTVRSGTCGVPTLLIEPSPPAS